MGTIKPANCGSRIYFISKSKNKQFLKVKELWRWSLPTCHIYCQYCSFHAGSIDYVEGKASKRLFECKKCNEQCESIGYSLLVVLVICLKMAVCE